MAIHWVCGELDAESCDSVETVTQRGIEGQKLLSLGFWNKYGVIVAIATACAINTTQWVYGERDAELCDSVETVAQRRIGGQHCLEMVFE